MKKRIMVAMGLMAALLVVAAGVAWAANVNCQVGEPRRGHRRGGGGKDVIFAHDNEFDTINCGRNVDEVTFDKGLDRVAANCEKRKPRTLMDQDAQAQEEVRAALSLR